MVEGSEFRAAGLETLNPKPGTQLCVSAFFGRFFNTERAEAEHKGHGEESFGLAFRGRSSGL